MNQKNNNNNNKTNKKTLQKGSKILDIDIYTGICHGDATLKIQSYYDKLRDLKFTSSYSFPLAKGGGGEGEGE